MLESLRFTCIGCVIRYQTRLVDTKMTSKEEYLTAEELRARLYHGLKDKGVVDVLKVFHLSYS